MGFALPLRCHGSAPHATASLALLRSLLRIGATPLVSSNLPKPAKRWLLSSGDVAVQIEGLKAQASSLQTKLDEIEKELEAFSSAAHLNEALWYGNPEDIINRSFATMSERAQRALDAREHLPAWLDYCRERQNATNAGLEAFLKLAEDQHILPSDLIDVFEFVLFNCLVKEVFQQYPSLAQFSGLTHEKIRDRFIQLDHEIIQLYRERAASRIARRRVPPGNGRGPVSTYTDLALLQREIEKQTRPFLFASLSAGLEEHSRR